MNMLELQHILTEPIIWERDLEDDCIVKWRGFGAHAEKMDDDSWYCSVWASDDSVEKRQSAENIFHTADSDMMALSGPAARHLAEMVMRIAAAKRLSG
jgi:hypothetical protein